MITWVGPGAQLVIVDRMAGRRQQVNNETENISDSFLRYSLCSFVQLRQQQPLPRQKLQWCTRMHSMSACPNAGRQTNGILFVAATTTITTTYRS